MPEIPFVSSRLQVKVAELREGLLCTRQIALLLTQALSSLHALRCIRLVRTTRRTEAWSRLARMGHNYQRACCEPLVAYACILTAAASR